MYTSKLFKTQRTEEKKRHALLLPAWGSEHAQGIISIIDLHALKIQHFSIGEKTELITTEHETIFHNPNERANFNYAVLHIMFIF